MILSVPKRNAQNFITLGTCITEFRSWGKELAYWRSHRSSSDISVIPVESRRVFHLPETMPPALTMLLQTGWNPILFSFCITNSISKVQKSTWSSAWETNWENRRKLSGLFSVQGAHTPSSQRMSYIPKQLTIK